MIIDYDVVKEMSTEIKRQKTIIKEKENILLVMILANVHLVIFYVLLYVWNH